MARCATPRKHAEAHRRPAPAAASASSATSVFWLLLREFLRFSAAPRLLRCWPLSQFPPFVTEPPESPPGPTAGLAPWPLLPPRPRFLASSPRVSPFLRGSAVTPMLAPL